MSDRSKTMAKILILRGRIDVCEKIVTDLQQRIEQDQRQLDMFESEINGAQKGADN